MTGQFRLGLTGSIGMGKSTTAQMFSDAGIAVWDADACVHALYAVGGAAVDPIARAFPGVVLSGAVDRVQLKARLQQDPAALARLEAIVHPLTAAAREAFLRGHAQDDIVVLDIPLLYETGAQNLCDAVLVVTVPEAVQRARVLARGTMSESELARILARQMPDAQKRARADYIIETLDLDTTRRAVQNLINQIRTRHA